MSLPLSLAGHAGEALAFDGGVLRAVSPRAFAPGAPVALVVAGPDGALALHGKSLGSKRRDDGRFDVRLRMVSLRREEREALTALLGARPD